MTATIAPYDSDWFPPLPERRYHDYTHSVALTASLHLAEHQTPSPLEQRVQTYLEASYGISHPDALDRLVPIITATCQALTGQRHDQDKVVPTVRRQLRHTLALDARPLTGAGDLVWQLGPALSNRRRPQASTPRQRTKHP